MILTKVLIRKFHKELLKVIRDQIKSILESRLVDG